MNYFLIIACAAVLLEAVADIFFKVWAGNHKLWIIIAGMLLYTAGTFVWAYSLKFEQLSKAISVFTVLNLVVVILAGVFFFKEDLSFINKIGIALGVLNVVFMQF